MKSSERGSAIVEFHFLGILLLVPLVYIMLAVLDVQRTAYAVTQAAREAGRLYVATGDEAAARAAAAVALIVAGSPTRKKPVQPSSANSLTCAWNM